MNANVPVTGSAGVDVSAWNHGLNLASLTGLDFVIAKATEGTTYVDPTYETWAEQVKALNEKKWCGLGAYHFFHAEHANARAEAEYFIRYAGIRPGLSLWLDYETYGPSSQQDAEEIALFISTVKIEYPKAKMGIYANGTGLARILPFVKEIPFNGFWYAGPSVPMTQNNTAIPWNIHQYEELNGVDRDYCPDARELWKLWEWQ